LRTKVSGKTCRRHQSGDVLATDANAFGRKIDMNARRPVDAARSLVKMCCPRNNKASWPTLGFMIS
jgi:hypothetical protein